ncbi:MAG: hypothetical protein Q8P33_00095 [bacterium]|nr:hypothetical protein [bacterium]
MNWMELLNFNFHQLRGELADLWRNNRRGIREFLEDRFVYLAFFCGVFFLAHLASVGSSLLIELPSPGNPGGWSLAMALDFVLVVVSTGALWGALVQVAILYTGGALLLDGVEGVPNMLGGLFRHIARMRGVEADIAGERRIGLDKISSAARDTRATVFVLTVANLFWWLVIWGAYGLQQPIATVERVTLFLAFALVFCCAGYASTYSSALRTDTDSVQAQVWRNRIAWGSTGTVVFSLLFTGLLVHRFGWSPEVSASWSEWAEGKGLLLWGVALVLVGAYIRQFGRTRSLAKYVWGMGIVLFLLSPLVWQTTPPGRAGQVVTKVTHAAADRIEGALVPSAAAAAAPAATTPPPAPPAKATSGFNFEIASCDSREMTLDVAWIAPNGATAPLESGLPIAPRGEPGSSKRYQALAAPAGTHLLVALKNGSRRLYSLEVDGSTLPPRFRRDRRFTNAADPSRDWNSLEFREEAGGAGFWRLSAGCAAYEEP